MVEAVDSAKGVDEEGCERNWTLSWLDEEDGSFPLLLPEGDVKLRHVRASSTLISPLDILVNSTPIMSHSRLLSLMSKEPHN